MANLGTRIWRRVKNTFCALQSDCSFSPYLGLLRVMDELGGRVRLKKISSWAHARKDQWILDYLKQDLSSVIEKYKNDDNCGAPVANAPIWVCWWTGENSAPPIVKHCIASIRRNAGSHPVRLITQDDFREYLEIPSEILVKVQSGQICFANFSDYLRFSLLAKYGGLWLDATIYCSAQLPEEIFRMPVFTCKSPERECGYISRYRWTSFCFGGYCGGLLFSFMRDSLALFWEKNGRSIDYLLVDYLIDLAYSEIPAIRVLMESIPINNPHRDDLQAAMNAALPAEAFNQIIQEDTFLYKLSWRETYAEITADGRETIFSGFARVGTEA